MTNCNRAWEKLIEWGKEGEVQGRLSLADDAFRVPTYGAPLTLSWGAQAGVMIPVARSALA